MNLFIAGFLLCLSLCLDLGIVNIAIIKAGMEKGFRPSFSIGLGSTFGDLVYAVFSVFGVSLLLGNIWFRGLLWMGGTIILLYMSVKMVIQSFRPEFQFINGIEQKSKLGTKKGYITEGFLLALTSPTSILWFASVGGSIIAAKSSHGRFDYIYLLSGFSFGSLLWSVILAWISYKSGQIMKNKIRRILSIISSLVFLILAIIIFVNGYRTFI